MRQFKLLGISGSLRKDATNRKLLSEAVRLFDGADYDVADLNVPLFNADVQESDGIPPSVQLLADQIAGADGVLISTPEYNKSISGVLKNALDWVSRTDGAPWRGKPVAIMSAAAGRAGGERAQSALRLCLVPFRPRLVPGPELMLASSGHAFDENGYLIDPLSITALGELMQGLRSEIEAKLA
jgi:chromate reductase, NAD(P)H dehydrogenase (quinone)